MDTFLYHIEENIGFLELHRGQAHNVLNQSMIEDLTRQLKIIKAQPALRCLVISAAGDSFCAGVAINEMNDPSWGTHLFEQLINAVYTLKIPTIAAMNGSAFGGGAELALACDFRIGAENIVVQIPPARLGLHYPISGLKRYVHTLGSQACKRLFLKADRLTAKDLLNIHFLDEVCPVGEALQQATAWAEHIAHLAPLSVQGMKQSINELAHHQYCENTLNNRVDICLNSKDLQEGLAAFKEKRKARFLGK